MVARLRSTERAQHFGAYYELVTYASLAHCGYRLQVGPTFPEGKPDFLIEGCDLHQPAIVEVAAVFDEHVWTQERKKLDTALDALSRLSSPFILDISLTGQTIAANVDRRGLAGEVQAWLDNLPRSARAVGRKCYCGGHPPTLECTVLDVRKESGPVVEISGLPARWLGSQHLRRIVTAKLKRYKTAKSSGIPLIVVLALSSSPWDIDSVLEALYGTLQVTWTRDAGGTPSGETRVTRNLDGIVSPRRDSASMSNYSRLSAVVCIESSRQPCADDADQRMIRFRYHVLHNPFSAAPIPAGFLPFALHLTRVSKTDEPVRLAWDGDLPPWTDLPSSSHTL